MNKFCEMRLIDVCKKHKLLLNTGIENYINEPAVIVKPIFNIDFVYCDTPFVLYKDEFAYSSLNNDFLDNRYLYHYLKKYIKYFKSIAQGSRKQIIPYDVDNFYIFIPNIEYQIKVANILDELENYIFDNSNASAAFIEKYRNEIFNYF